MNPPRPREWFEQPGHPHAANPGEAGLRFQCTQCGNCCTGPPGYVLFTDDEAQALADHLRLAEADFRAAYTHHTPAGPSLRERPTPFGNDCVFLDRDTIPGKAVCSVYEHRPAQCRTWPFWPDNLDAPRDWRRATQTCPGMNQGTLYPPEHIRITRAQAIEDEKNTRPRTR
ncbi:MAG: YkgJ family cysteine cluster protein [Phycisphaerales bacterium]|nr:MAG: YkgJ family cysteine cluster protein [Phycisphaerales bacterium]